MINLSELKVVLDFNHETGVFVWKERTSIRITVGSKAGTLQKNGYLATSVLGDRVYLHRLAWFYHYGVWPDGQVDHINHDRSDNRVINLRVVKGHKENSKNCKMKKNNTSGITGVSWDKSKELWVAQMSSDGVRVLFERFSTKEEAIKVRKDAEVKYKFHTNHGKFMESK